MLSKTPPTKQFLLIRAGRLIDSVADKPILNGAVLIQGSTIIGVGPANSVQVPEGASAEVFEFPGKTLMPGMVDCHTHHNGFGDGTTGETLGDMPDDILALQSARNARASLFTGVTTIRENGPKSYTMLRFREAVEAGMTQGPKTVLCGWPVAIVGGHMWYFGGQATGKKEVRTMVRQLVEQGADYIKVTATGGTTATSYQLLPSFNVEELTALAETAHDLGRLTAAHCTSTQGIVNALDAGIDMIIHCFFREADGAWHFREDIAERIGKQGVFVNPTLHVQRSVPWALQHKKKDQALTKQEENLLDMRWRSYETNMEDSRRMAEMGLKLITGSDSSWNDYKLGNTVYEVEQLVEVGYSPMKAVKSVTSDAAKALEVHHTVGSLEVGKEADIIIVDGDPSKDVSALWNVHEVFLAGKRVERGSEQSLASFHQYPP